MGPVPPHCVLEALFLKPQLLHSHSDPPPGFTMAGMPLPICIIPMWAIFPMPPMELNCQGDLQPKLPLPPQTSLAALLLKPQDRHCHSLGALQPIFPVPPHCVLVALFLKPHLHSHSPGSIALTVPVTAAAPPFA
eukprot:CAMPEP_0197629748 /NCGR_PEP_ID=MMETSP1338-20131121/7478_1 /TAXON_ID=43686 ORGANISM="Pelagodinium beii, Strain RCC1491" /NCGR_SAMPLE_ID=MMETSP1338 /ASSEMBLY_ACC=CAM_ASM_000754 /LENGTH=134 /DNA_ID=CAMNT_0043200841 /DNA_START=130 /DNA_END=534 /DNA_ORIENTATION=-